MRISGERICYGWVVLATAAVCELPIMCAPAFTAFLAISGVMLIFTFLLEAKAHTLAHE